jgi:hypothetical protein
LPGTSFNNEWINKEIEKFKIIIGYFLWKRDSKAIIENHILRLQKKVVTIHSSGE